MQRASHHDCATATDETINVVVNFTQRFSQRNDIKTYELWSETSRSRSCSNRVTIYFNQTRQMPVGTTVLLQRCKRTRETCWIPQQLLATEKKTAQTLLSSSTALSFNKSEKQKLSRLSQVRHSWSTPSKCKTSHPLELPNALDKPQKEPHCWWRKEFPAKQMLQQLELPCSRVSKLVARRPTITPAVLAKQTRLKANKAF